MSHSLRRSAGAAVYAQGHWLAGRADGGLGTVEVEVAEQQPPEAHHGRVKNPYPLAFHRHSDSSRRSSLFSMELAFVACCIFLFAHTAPGTQRHDRAATTAAVGCTSSAFRRLLALPGVFIPQKGFFHTSPGDACREESTPAKPVRPKCNLVAPPPLYPPMQYLPHGRVSCLLIASNRFPICSSLALRLLVVYYARALSCSRSFCLPTCIVGLLSIGVGITGFLLLQLRVVVHSIS